MQLWDTSGQEKYKSIAENYYKNAKGMILVFSVTHRDSFEDVEDWLKQIKNKSRKDICLVLVGSQIDRPERIISSLEGQALAKRHGISYFETSAKTGENVKEVFKHITREVKEKILDKEPEVIDPGYTPTPKNCCQ